jgi:hypothetical protein
MPFTSQNIDEPVVIVSWLLMQVRFEKGIRRSIKRKGIKKKGIILG